MEMTLRLLGVGPGDEVITSAYTYTASASVIHHVGAKIVLVDTEKDSYHLSVKELEKAITEKTKVIIPVDLAGAMCDYDRIFQVVEQKRHMFNAKNHIQEAFGRVVVMADLAHSFGALYKGQKSGSVADFTSFSFHAVKNLTTAEGGAVTWKSISGLSDDEIYKQYMLLTLHGQSKDALAKTQLGAWEYDIVAPNYKCNMTDIMASIGLVQLTRYDDLLKKRKDIINHYNHLLENSLVQVMPHYTEKYESSGHLLITRVLEINDKDRNRIINELAIKGISSNVHYKPLPLLTAYKSLGFNIKDFSNSYLMYCNEITLPLHTMLNFDDINYIASNYVEITRESIMYRKFIKVILDILLSMLAMPIFILLFLIIAPLIYIEDKGTIFYNAHRLGKDKKIFIMYKFRTMKVNAEDIRNPDGSTFNSENDPRLTRIGKFLRKTSLDEVPQIINVLFQNMSIVGPRPDLPEHIHQYEGNEIDKLKVLPGITGYNQAYYRNSIDWKARLENDIFYANNVGFILDAKIILSTIIAVILRKNIFGGKIVVYRGEDKIVEKL